MQVSPEPDGTTYVFQGFIQGKDYGQFGLQRLGNVSCLYFCITHLLLLLMCYIVTVVRSLYTRTITLVQVYFGLSKIDTGSKLYIQGQYYTYST